MKCRVQIFLLGAFAVLACAALLVGNASSFQALEIDWTEPKPSADVSSAQEGVAPSTLPPTAVSDCIDLNTATAEELQRLPGIGENLSQKIVQYREECGQFFSVEEIMEVEGIGKKRYEAIKDYLKVTK